MNILEQHADKWIPVTETGCYIWLGTLAGGRPFIRLGSREKQKVSRLVCAEIYGPAPTPKHEAAHATPRGCIGGLCVNGDHLRWATRSENEMDKPEDVRRRVTDKARTAMVANLQGPRHAAKMAGEKYYIPDKPCVRGHTTSRLTTRGGCISCAQENDRNRWRDRVR